MGKLQFFVSRSLIVCACSILKSSLLHYTLYTIYIHYMTEKKAGGLNFVSFSISGGYPGVLENRGTKEKYLREEGTMNLF